MLAEMAMFFQILGMAILAAIVPALVVIFVIYLAYAYRIQIWHVIKAVMRFVKWSVMMLFNEPEAARHVTKTWRDKHAN